MNHLKKFENFDFDITSDDKIKEVIDFIKPSDPMMSDEYYYYCWGDDEAYYGEDDDGNKITIDDYLSTIEVTVFKEDSDTAKKFGFDFISQNKEKILNICREELNELFKPKKNKSSNQRRFDSKQKKVNESSYPTIDEVESASPEEIMRWQRFLPSPSGEDQINIINTIYDKYIEMRNSDTNLHPELYKIDSSTSKRVGWNEGKTEKLYKSKDTNIKKDEFRRTINNLIKSKGCETGKVGDDLEILFNKKRISQIMFRNDYVGVKKEGSKFTKEFKYDQLGKIKSEISDIVKFSKSIT